MVSFPCRDEDTNVTSVGIGDSGVKLHSRYIALALVGSSCFLLALNFPNLSGAQPSDASLSAEKLNSEGKALIAELNLEGAAAKFREAIGLVEDPRFAFNLCYTLEKSGGLEEAQRACKWVTGSTNPRLAKKAAVLLKKVEAKLNFRREKIPSEPTGVPLPPTGETPSKPPLSGAPPLSGEPTSSPRENPGNTGSPAQPSYPPPGVSTPPVAPPPMVVGKPKPNRWGLRFGATNSSAENLTATDGSVLSGVFGAMFTRSFGSSFQLMFEGQIAGRGAELVEADFFEDREQVDLELTYLDFSSTSRYSLGQGRLKPFFEIGSTISFLLLSERTGGVAIAPEPDLPILDFSLNFGGGILMGSLEFRIVYMRGLLDLSGDDIENGPVHSRSTQFAVGYWF